jgi:hypothetical protein
MSDQLAPVCLANALNLSLQVCQKFKIVTKSFTDYEKKCTQNQIIEEVNNIQNHAKYRQMAFRLARWQCGREF